MRKPALVEEAETGGLRGRRWVCPQSGTGAGAPHRPGSCSCRRAVEALLHVPFVFVSGAQIKQLVKVRAELLTPTVVFHPESQGFPMKAAKHLLDLPFKNCFVA